MHREIGFWAAVALVAVIGVTLFKLIGIKLGDTVPGLGALANFI